MSVKIAYFPVNDYEKSVGALLDKKFFAKCWSNKKWIAVYRSQNKIFAEKIAVKADEILKDKKLSFSINPVDIQEFQKNKWDIPKEAQMNNADLLKILINSVGIRFSGDCSLNFSETGKSLKLPGFNILKDDKFLKNSSYLQRGDLLIADGFFAIALSNGDKVQESISVGSASIKKENILNDAYCGQGIATATSRKELLVKVGAGDNYKTIFTLGRGSEVEILEILDNDWVKICWPKSATGYAFVFNKDKDSFFIPVKNLIISPAKVSYNVRLKQKLTPVYKACEDQKIMYIENNALYHVTKELQGYAFIGIGWVLLNDVEKV